MLGPQQGYVDILNQKTTEMLQKRRDEGKEFDRTPLRPSSSGNCTRELAYALMEFHKLASYEKPLLSPETHRIFSLGHSVEYNLLRDMADILKGVFEIKYKQQSLSFAQLTATNNPHFSQWLEGSIDLVLWSDEYKCVVDVKSKNSKYSSYRNNSWMEFSDKLRNLKSIKTISDNSFYADDLEAFLDEVNDPFLAANFLQLNLYACNPFLTERGVNHGAIIQYCKNDSSLREIRFKPSQVLYDYVILKMQTALNAADNNDPTIAPKEFNLGSIKCAFCNYNKTCWSDADPLKAFFRTFPKKQWPTNITDLSDETAALAEELYADYKIAAGITDSAQKIEESLCALLAANEVSKVRFADGEIFEVRLLKSPREHLVLRRSKL